MIHTYRHIFADGKLMTFAADLTTDKPRFVCSMTEIAPEHIEEYLSWVSDALLPDLVARMTAPQLAAMALIGLDKLGHSS